jgi:hypothetical protein
MDKTSAGLEKLGGQGVEVSLLNADVAGTPQAVEQPPTADAADLGDTKMAVPRDCL